MKKRGYTHVQELIPAMQQMVAEGKTQREIAEYYGFRDKEVVREALKRARRKEAAGIPKHRGRKPAKTLAEYKYENQRLKWKTNCCGIFCDPQKGSEDESKICSDLPSSRRISHSRYVPLFRSFPKWLLWFCSQNGQTRKRCRAGTRNSSTAREKFPDLRLSKNAFVFGKERNCSKSKNNIENYEKVQSAVWNTPPQKVGQHGPTTASLWKFT